MLRDLIKEAKKPCILTGHGIRAAKAIDEFYKLIEKLQMPVITTWRGMDLIEHDHPLFLGRTGLLNHKKAQDYQDICDLIICLGCRIDLMQTQWNYDKFAPKAYKVVCDIDEYELNKLPGDWLKMNMDVKEFINKLLEV